MKIANLHVRRFKSLYDVDLDLNQFSVITGPNGSGKSNLVDALAFLGEVYRFGFEYAVGRAGGIDAISFRDKRRTTIGVEFNVVAEFNIHEMRRSVTPRTKEVWDKFKHTKLQVRHQFTIKPATAQSGLDYVLNSEKVHMSAELNSQWQELLNIETKDGVICKVGTGATQVSPDFLRVTVGSAARQISYIQEELSTAHEGAASDFGTAMELVRLSPAIREYQLQMSLVRAYRLNSGATRKPAVPTPNATLDSDGGNLPAVVSRITKQQPKVWRQVLAGMRQLLPGLEEISTEPSPEHGLILLFKERDRGRPWSAHEVSDGTIQALALLLLIYDPRPPLIVVEEPENAVHPWVLRRFLEACRSLKEKQIILTTHSPILLKLVRPEEVFLMWRSKGRSRIRALVSTVPESQRLYYDEGFDVFELYDSGVISEAVPGLDGGDI